MSHFIGYLTKSNDNDLFLFQEKIINKSNSFFKSDCVATYQSENICLVNWFFNNSSESQKNTTIAESSTHILVASCRLDNREEIISIIESERGVIAKDTSDHFLLLYLFEIFKKQCVEYLIGDFSFVVWCKANQTLFMAKDHLGVRPLFYYKPNDDSLVFATSISLIKQVAKQPLELNLWYIAKELKDVQPNTDETFFRDIIRLKPAHYIYIDDLRASNYWEERYWDLSSIDLSGYANEKEIFDKILNLFQTAVACRTKTKKNIGCQLSGGMDSSAITVVLSRIFNKNKIHTYSFVLSKKTLPHSKNKIDEQPNQQTILKYANLKPENHHSIEDFHYTNTFEQFNTCNSVMGGYANSDCIWEDTLFNNASKDQVGFIMSGFPGDECVSNSGRAFYYDYLHSRKLSNILKFISLAPLSNFKKTISYYLAKYSPNFPQSYNQERNLLKTNSSYDKTIKHLNVLSTRPSFKDYLKSKICGTHPTLRMESEFLYASQYGIEPVYPMADIRLIQFVYSLPTEMFRPKKYERAIFREMCKNILPDSIRLQPKYNGAFTLAFFEYWKKKQTDELKTYQVIDYFDLFHTKGLLNWNNTEKKRLIANCKIDFLININSIHEKE